MDTGESIPERIGGYRVLRRLAVGGTSDVLLARAEGPHGFERVVVLKLLLPQYRHNEQFERMFAREAAAYARLSHPAIVRLFDFFSQDGQLVMVLEYVDGLSLDRARAMLKQHGHTLDDKASLFLMSRVFAALSTAHAAKDPETSEFAPVIHRDVNPANILLPWDGHAKLADFGIAKIAGIQGDTKAGYIKGTYGYMAPEQVRGEALTPRADVYAACLMLWELLTHRKAIVRGNLPEMELLRAMAEPQFPSIDALRPDLPQSLRVALSRGLEPLPDRRAILAEELVLVLRGTMNLEEGRVSLAHALALVRPPPSDDDMAKTASRGLSPVGPDDTMQELRPVSPSITNELPVLPPATPAPKPVEALPPLPPRAPLSRTMPLPMSASAALASVAPPVPPIPPRPRVGLGGTQLLASAPPPSPLPAAAAPAPPPVPAPAAHPPVAPVPPAPPEVPLPRFAMPSFPTAPSVPTPPPMTPAQIPQIAATLQMPPTPPPIAPSAPPPPPVALAPMIEPSVQQSPTAMAAPMYLGETMPSAPPAKKSFPWTLAMVLFLVACAGGAVAVVFGIRAMNEGSETTSSLVVPTTSQTAATTTPTTATTKATATATTTTNSTRTTVATTSATASATGTATATSTATATTTSTSTPTSTSTSTTIPTSTATATATATATVATTKPVESVAVVAPPSGTTGIIDTSEARPGHRVFINEWVPGQTPGRFTVHCGRIPVKLGSQGTTQSIDVPCGGEVKVFDR